MAGGQDVVDVLTQDHRELTSLLAELVREVDPNVRRDLADTLAAELVRHAVAGEMQVYPAMLDHLGDGLRAVQHELEQNTALERTLQELEGEDTTTERFHQLLRVLQEQLREHIGREESETFPTLRGRVPREQLVDLAEKVERTKRLSPTRAHPAVPSHGLAGPATGLVDRWRNRRGARATR